MAEPLKAVFPQHWTLKAVRTYNICLVYQIDVLVAQ